MAKKEEKVVETKSEEIVVRDIAEVRPVELPLIVELPASANSAQVAYAKVLNQYAYTNRAKWEVKKDALIAKLKNLKEGEYPIEDGVTIKTL